RVDRGRILEEEDLRSGGDGHARLLERLLRILLQLLAIRRLAPHSGDDLGDDGPVPVAVFHGMTSVARLEAAGMRAKPARRGSSSRRPWARSQLSGDIPFSAVPADLSS